MNYTGSSCEDTYNNNPETGDKSGYYCINNKWTYCNMNKLAASDTGDFISTCAGVDGRWRRITNEFTIVKNILTTVHALMVEATQLHPLRELIITVNQDLPITTITMSITSMTYCGTDLATLLAIAVMIQTNYGFTVNCVEKQKGI